MPLREQGRYLVEPGHHYKWMWLLNWFGRASSLAGFSVSQDLAGICDRLLALADNFGLDPQIGAAINGIWSDGTTQAPAFRLWPQTERLKAEARRTQGLDRFAEAHMALSRFIDGVPLGLWRERLVPLGVPSNEPAPATSLYHLTTALTDSLVVSRLSHP